MVVAFIGLGSNIGNRRKNIAAAITRLKTSRVVRVLKLSSLRVTEPVGPNQRDFVNGVAKIKTDLSAEKLLKVLKEIERLMGRRTVRRWGPRGIDLDVLLFGNRIIRTKSLQVPHRQLHRRLFVLDPLAEISPGTVHPVLKKTVFKLRNSYIAAEGRREKVNGRWIKRT